MADGRIHTVGLHTRANERVEFRPLPMDVALNGC